MRAGRVPEQLCVLQPGEGEVAMRLARPDERLGYGRDGWKVSQKFVAARVPRPVAQPQQQAHSKSIRFKSSISSDNVASAVTRPVIFRTAWRTVVWSRPPNSRPISGSERGVKSLDRYMAIWRGRTTPAGRRP